ncbi:hypothetical protein HKX48_003239 [Thoreauomyces humboldtii]|nr:hypothetical protein HKX48_003239 [Thoreauomyces humboldtii]
MSDPAHRRFTCTSEAHSTYVQAHPRSPKVHNGSTADYYPGKYRSVEVPVESQEAPASIKATTSNHAPKGNVGIHPPRGPHQPSHGRPYQPAAYGSHQESQRSHDPSHHYPAYGGGPGGPQQSQRSYDSSQQHPAYGGGRGGQQNRGHGSAGRPQFPGHQSNNPSFTRYRSPNDAPYANGGVPPKVLSTSAKHNAPAVQQRQYQPPPANRAQLMANALNLHRPDSPYWSKKGDHTAQGIAPPSSAPGYAYQPQRPSNESAEMYGSGAGSNISKTELKDLFEAIPDDDAEVTVDSEHQPPEVTITLMPHQLKGVAWMKSREAGSSNGGILADDMGLGKTVQTISLIVANRSKDAHCKTTLIVAPLALIKQWEQEILTKTKARTLKVLLYHGPGRTKDPVKLKSYDVVITTFQVIASECPKLSKPLKKDLDQTPKVLKEGGPLFDVKWFRIVLDEAQTIKNKTTKSAIGCCELSAQLRFCLSGTPIQNSIDELYSLLKFLRFNPFNDYSVFKHQIADPLNRGRSKVAMERLRVILKALMLRRTKTTVLDGKPVLDLPARNVHLVKVQFNARDLEFYTQLERKMKTKLKSLQKDGGSNYTNILCLLLRLRQACNHRSLVGAGADTESEIAPKPVADDEEEDVDEMLAMFKTLEVDAENRQCTICFEQLVGVPSDQKQCLDCTDKFVSSEAVKRGAAVSSIRGKRGKNAALVDELTRNWYSSAKIDKTLEILDDLRLNDPTSKIIVFSQFTTMLDVVEVPLRAKGYKFCRYDGSMPNPERERSIESIRTDPDVTVMLISLKCGSLGLNLTAANRVIMLDMWWNPALEDQAIDRVHRIGQTKPVEVTRFTVEGTVEDRILALQLKKRTLIEGALGDATFKKTKKMTVDELIGLFG